MHRTEEHLMLVTQERSLYRNEVERSRKAVYVHFGQEGVFVPLTPNRVIAPATNLINMHYSFNFAQQVYWQRQLNVIQYLALISRARRSYYVFITLGGARGREKYVWCISHFFKQEQQYKVHSN